MSLGHPWLNKTHADLHLELRETWFCSNCSDIRDFKNPIQFPNGWLRTPQL